MPMHTTAALALGFIVLGAAGLWLVVRIGCAIGDRRRRREWAAREKSGCITVCEYGPNGPNGIRWIVRRPLSERPPRTDVEVPAFLRKHSLEDD
jgi:hypothetical protein